jgi:acetolactate synthase small subunit
MDNIYLKKNILYNECVMRHTFSALVENKSGVLARVFALFDATCFKIASLSVSEIEEML